MSEQATIAVCKTCGFPVKVVFNAEGEIEATFAVCGHIEKVGNSGFPSQPQGPNKEVKVPAPTSAIPGPSRLDVPGDAT